MTSGTIDPATDASGSAQLDGLLAHIHDTTQQVLGQTGVASQSAALVRYVVECFTRFARSYYQAFSAALRADPIVSASPQLYAYQRQHAIERLCSNWDTLVPLLYATADPRVRVIEALFTAALPNPYWLGLMMEQWEAQADDQLGKPRARSRSAPPEKQLHFITVPFFSRRFELLRFFYAPYVAISGVPIYDLEAPWNWHVVWHELAGHIIQVMQARGVIDRLAQQIRTGTADDAWSRWRTHYEHAPGTTPQPGDEPWKDIKPADFIAELLEDAYAVLALGATTLPTLERVLAQHYRDAYTLEDRRHPPMQLRLDCAVICLQSLGLAQAELAPLGVSDAQIERCASIQPGIQLLLDALLGNDQPAIVARRAERLLTSQIEPLQQHLLNDTAAPGLPNIPTLIAAARTAFEAQPDEREAIARRAMAMMAQRAQPTDAVGLSPIKTLPPPTDQFFADLVSDMSWEQLLHTAFQATDLATPFGHKHPHQDVNLRFTSDDGWPHTIAHNQFEHN